ncbi:MAG: MazG nucleotide pyrophosphohydrolase domain-containing protein [bacterium]
MGNPPEKQPVAKRGKTRRTRARTAPHSLDGLRGLIKKLRSENGCPWDRRQTLSSIAPYLREEVDEALRELKKNSIEDFSEELGDVFLILVMMIQIAEEEGLFTFEDVMTLAAEKIVRRHPHVFSGLKVSSLDEIVANWKKIKETEKRGRRG